QVDEGGLARASGANQRYHFASTRMQGDVLQDWLLGRVSKANVLITHLTQHALGKVLELFRLTSMNTVLTGSIHDVEDAFTGSTRCLQHLVQPVQASDWFIEERQIEHEADQLADSHAAGQHLTATDPENECKAQRTGK